MRRSPKLADLRRGGPHSWEIIARSWHQARLEKFRSAFLLLQIRSLVALSSLFFTFRKRALETAETRLLQWPKATPRSLRKLATLITMPLSLSLRTISARMLSELVNRVVMVLEYYKSFSTKPTLKGSADSTMFRHKMLYAGRSLVLRKRRKRHLLQPSRPQPKASLRPSALLGPTAAKSSTLGRRGSFFASQSRLSKNSTASTVPWNCLALCRTSCCLI